MWIRRAASRYLKDRRRAEKKSGPFYFDDDHANDACDFIEKLPHVEGRWDSPDIVLHPAHIFFVVNLFGFRNHDGTRRFTSALMSIARKNAKSTLAAAILLYCFSCEGEPGAQIISAATTGAQARIVFNIAKKMVDKTPDLVEQFSLEPFTNSIVNWDDSSTFKPINAKASTQDGLNPSHTCCDEIHAHKSPDLLNVLKSAAGARSNPLWLYTTTEGYETPGPWPEMRSFAENILKGIIEADHFLVCIWALDDDEGKPGDEHYRPADDDFDESKWVKANPLMSVNPLLMREIRKAATDAKQMPSSHSEFRIKRLNRRASAANSWLNIDKWRRCNQPVDLVRMRGHPCFGAIDGASTRDLFAFRLVWEIEGEFYTWGMRWVPEEQVSMRSERGLVPYASWVQQGFIRQTPGATIDYDIVRATIESLIEEYNPTKIAYDPWNLSDLIRRLKSRFPDTQIKKDEYDSLFVPFRQGPKSYSPAMKETERLYMSGLLHHGDDPVLNWCANNVVPRYDENENIAPNRFRSADKIDDAVALFMAIGVMHAFEAKEPDYQIYLL